MSTRALAVLAWVVASIASAFAQAPARERADDVRLEVLDLRAVPLDEACRMIADASGLNLAPSSGAAVTSVSIYLKDVGALAALQALCQAHGLWMQRDEETGIVRIRTASEYARDLGGLAPERTEHFTLLYPNAYDVGYAIRNLFGDRVELSTSDNDSDVRIELSERLSRFDLLARRTQGFGTSFGNGTSGYGGAPFGTGYDSGYAGGVGVDGVGYGAYGGLAGGGQYSSGGLRANANVQRRTGAAEGQGNADETELSADEIGALENAQGNVSSADRERVVRELTRRSQAPILVNVAGRHNQLAVRTRDEASLSEIRALVRKLDVPTALVLLEVRVLSVDLQDGEESFFEYQWADGELAGSFATGTIEAPTPPALGPAGTGLRTGDLIFQIVDSTFAARLQALETENRVRTVSTPVLLTANNEVSRLFVGREVPLNRSFGGGQVVTNEATSTTVTGSTSIEFRPVGTTLLITPNINADRTVTLRIVQETSQVDSSATVLVPDEGGFTPQQIGVVSSQSVSGTVVAQSDRAVVFGGLIEEGVDDAKEQVPFLGDVPLLGVLFQRKEKRATRREIVIVVRPRVMSTPAESEASSAGLLEALGVDAPELPFGAANLDRAPAAAAFRVHGLRAEEDR